VSYLLLLCLASFVCFYLFIYISDELQVTQSLFRNPQLIKASHTLYGTTSFKNLIHTIFLQDSIKCTFISMCNLPLSFGFPYQNLWMYFCSVQHKPHSPHISSNSSQYSTKPKVTYYNVFFYYFPPITAIRIPLQENVN
jgi:hypothetical protein